MNITILQNNVPDAANRVSRIIRDISSSEFLEKILDTDENLKNRINELKVHIPSLRYLDETLGLLEDCIRTNLLSGRIPETKAVSAEIHLQHDATRLHAARKSVEMASALAMSDCARCTVPMICAGLDIKKFTSACQMLKLNMDYGCDLVSKWKGYDHVRKEFEEFKNTGQIENADLNIQACMELIERHLADTGQYLEILYGPRTNE